MRDELKVFFTDHFRLSHRLHDDEFLTRLGHVFSRLNDLNLGFNVRNKMIKLELFSVCINKDNTQVFPSLHDILCVNELKLTDHVKCDIGKHLRELGAQLCRLWLGWLMPLIIFLAFL